MDFIENRKRLQALLSWLGRHPDSAVTDTTGQLRECLHIAEMEGKALHHIEWAEELANFLSDAGRDEDANRLMDLMKAMVRSQAELEMLRGYHETD